MGTRVIRTDDLTGKDAEVTKQYALSFTPQDKKDSLEATEATVDLTPDSAKALWRWLAENDSRDLAGVLRKSPVRIAGSDAGETSEAEVIRNWAKQQDEFKATIKDRGAIPGNVTEAYRKAHPVTPPADTPPADTPAAS